MDALLLPSRFAPNIPTIPGMSFVSLTAHLPTKCLPENQVQANVYSCPLDRLGSSHRIFHEDHISG
jgi:hypothetical protein